LGALLRPPLFHLPPHRVAHTRHAMPMNVVARNYKPSAAERKAGKFQGDPSIVFDTFVCIGRHDALLVHWPDADLAAEDGAALARLVGNLTSLGRVEGWVRAELTAAAADWNCVPQGDRAAAEPVAVFCPDSATAFSDEHYPAAPDAKRLKQGLKPDDLLFD